MARIIDARVRQKAATLEEWNNSDLDSLDGEQLFVRSEVDDKVIGFKLGAKNKKFSELDYPDFTVRGKVSPTSTWVGRQSGVYIPTSNGVYKGIEVNLADGYQVLYWDGATIEKVVYPADYSGAVFGGVIDDSTDLSTPPTEPTWYIASAGNYNTTPAITLTENSILTWDGTQWSHIPFELEVRGEFLVADNIAEVRNITPEVSQLLVNGTYKGVEVLGYYEKGDTPASIIYYLSDTTEEDDGGSVIEVGVLKFEHKFNGSVNPAYFGAKDDGIFDCTVPLQKSIDLGLDIELIGRYLTTAPININSPIKIKGISKSKTYIITIGNDGLVINSSSVTLQDFTIGNNIRHTVTPNNLTGITCGVGTRLDNCVFRNIAVDGCRRAFLGSQIWNTNWNGFATYFCEIGIEFDGLSVNNTIDGNTNIMVEGVGSKGIYLNGRVPSEGLFISNTIIFGAETAIECIAFSHLYVTNSFLDFCTKFGALILDNGTNGSFNNVFTNNYIALSGSGGLCGLYLKSNIDHPSGNRVDKIINNDILVYQGSSGVKGLFVEGTGHKNPLIFGNTLKGFNTYDIECYNGSDAIINNNSCLSDLPTNIVADKSAIDNVGVVSFYSNENNYIKIGNTKIGFNTSISGLTTGKWKKGDIIFNLNSDMGTNVGWVALFDDYLRPFGQISEKMIKSGTTAQRPSGIEIGYDYYDTTINKPIWWNGTEWVDSTGAVV